MARARLVSDLATKLKLPEPIGLWGPRSFAKGELLGRASGSTRISIVDLSACARPTAEASWRALAEHVAPGFDARSATHAIEQLLFRGGDLVLCLKRLETARDLFGDQLIYEVFERWTADARRGREPWSRVRIVLSSCVPPSELPNDAHRHADVFHEVPDLTQDEVLSELGFEVSDTIWSAAAPLIGGHPEFWRSVQRALAAGEAASDVAQALPLPSGPLSWFFDGLKRELFQTPGLADACIDLAYHRIRTYNTASRLFLLSWGIAKPAETGAGQLRLRYEVYRDWARQLG